jgi:hypothetical protein
MKRIPKTKKIEMNCHLTVSFHYETCVVVLSLACSSSLLAFLAYATFSFPFLPSSVILLVPRFALVVAVLGVLCQMPHLRDAGQFECPKPVPVSDSPLAFERDLKYASVWFAGVIDLVAVEGIVEQHGRVRHNCSTIGEDNSFLDPSRRRCLLAPTLPNPKFLSATFVVVADVLALTFLALRPVSISHKLVDDVSVLSHQFPRPRVLLPPSHPVQSIARSPTVSFVRAIVAPNFLALWLLLTRYCAIAADRLQRFVPSFGAGVLDLHGLCFFVHDQKSQSRGKKRAQFRYT